MTVGASRGEPGGMGLHRVHWQPTGFLRKVETMSLAKKVVVVGLDSAGSRLTERYIAEGLLPNMAKVKEKGTYLDALCPFPTITPPGWTTISTGVWPGTHGITGFYTHHGGEPLDRNRWGSGFDSRECQVEFLWEMAEREGIGSILLNYPASWPPRTKKVWQVAGCGLGKENYLKLNDGQLFATEDVPLATQMELRPASGWKGMKGDGEFMEAELKVESKYGEAKSYWLLAGEEVSLHGSKDCSDELGTLPAGAWSEWMKTKLAGKEGEVAAALRMKVLEYDRAAGRIRVFLPEVFPIEGFTEPAELSGELVENVGPFLEEPAHVGINQGFIGDEEFLELVEYQDSWYAKAATHLMKSKDWGVLFLHAHGIDYAQHLYLRYLGRDKGKEACLRRAYASADAMVGQIYEAADDETLFVVVSDHGATCSPGDDIDLYGILKDAELASYEEPFPGLRQFDWAKTKAIPNRSSYVYVNLKGRDPEGCVEPEDYEAVREEVLHVLQSYREPQTQESPFFAVMSKEEARAWGLYGEGVGDVVYSLRPEHASEHGKQHPAARRGITSMESLMMMAGPGVKQNHRSEAVAFLTDVVPTICHLTDLPVPPRCEGGVICDALVEPNAPIRRLKKLERDQETLAKALAEHRRLTHS